MSAEENMRLMKTLDDSWNSQDWETFSKRHTEDVIVRWPGQTEPTRGLTAHRNEGVQMFKMFPDNHVENNPYKVLLPAIQVMLMETVRYGVIPCTSITFVMKCYFCWNIHGSISIKKKDCQYLIRGSVSFEHC
jgi:hypothetical protein